MTAKGEGAAHHSGGKAELHEKLNSPELGAAHATGSGCASIWRRHARPETHAYLDHRLESRVRRAAGSYRRHLSDDLTDITGACRAWSIPSDTSMMRGVRARQRHRDWPARVDTGRSASCSRAARPAPIACRRRRPAYPSAHGPGSRPRRGRILLAARARPSSARTTSRGRAR